MKSFNKLTGNIEAVFEKEISTEHKKTVTLIVGNIDHEDAMCLLLAAEKETVATGDQSLSAAISANKAFTYEAVSHKETLRDSINKRHPRFPLAFWSPDFISLSRDLGLKWKCLFRAVTQWICEYGCVQSRNCNPFFRQQINHFCSHRLFI